MYVPRGKDGGSLACGGSFLYQREHRLDSETRALGRVKAMLRAEKMDELMDILDKIVDIYGNGAVAETVQE